MQFSSVRTQLHVWFLLLLKSRSFLNLANSIDRYQGYASCQQLSSHMCLSAYIRAHEPLRSLLIPGNVTQTASAPCLSKTIVESGHFTSPDLLIAHARQQDTVCLIVRTSLGYNLLPKKREQTALLCSRNMSYKLVDWLTK